MKFQRIDLMDNQWAIEGKFDVIFFRNALIYFNRETQRCFCARCWVTSRRGAVILGHY